MALSEAATSMALIIVAAESGRPASKSSVRLCSWMTRGLGASEGAKAPTGPQIKLPAQPRLCQGTVPAQGLTRIKGGTPPARQGAEGQDPLMK